jgi:hypothetical protein
MRRLRQFVYMCYVTSLFIYFLDSRTNLFGEGDNVMNHDRGPLLVSHSEEDVGGREMEC